MKVLTYFRLHESSQGTISFLLVEDVNIKLAKKFQENFAKCVDFFSAWVTIVKIKKNDNNHLYTDHYYHTLCVILFFGTITTSLKALTFD